MEESQVATGTNLFLVRVREAFATDIESGGFTVAYERFYAAGEGDAELILEGGGLRFRLERERSCESTLVAGMKRPDEWFHLNVAMKAIARIEEPFLNHFVNTRLELDKLPELIRMHAPVLVAAFQAPWWRWRGTRRKLDETRRNALDDVLRSAKKTQSK